MLFLNINNKSTQSNLAFWRQGKAQWVLIFLATTIMFMPSTLAKSLDEYCVSRIGQKPKPTKVASYADKNQRQVTVRTGSALFDISIDHSDLVLKRKGSSVKLSEVKVPPYSYSSIIESITLTKDQWLWADGFEIDYMVAVNTNTTLPTFGKPTLFPKIYSHPCSMLANFFGCLRAQGIYSKTLGRAFVEGHRVNFFGFSEPVSFEMMQGTVKPLPKTLQGARFVADVPQLNGALFRGVSDEAVFYDGITFTTLLPVPLNRSKNDDFVSWRIEDTQSGQTFLSNFGYSKDPKKTLFLAELKAGPILRPLSMPAYIKNDWLNLFKLSHNSRLWGVARHKLVTEIKGNLKTIINVKEPFVIDSFNASQKQDGTLAFTVENPKTKSSTQYFIVKSSPAAHCKATLDINKPILLSE
jgi:hypothetical protein